MKSVRGWLSIIGFLALIGFTVWWFYPRYTPTAYVGYQRSYEAKDGNTYVQPPHGIARIDLLSGEIADTFSLSKNVPRLRTIAVDWKRNELYAGGQGISEYNPRFGEMKSQGIDVYEIPSGKLKQRIEFGVDEIRGDNFRFYTHNFGRLFIRNPLPDEAQTTEELKKSQWVIDPETKKVVDRVGGFGSSIVGPTGKYAYHMNGRYKIIGMEEQPPRKIVYSIYEEKIVLEAEGKKQFLKHGGFQPDPEGKFEGEPFTLDYPQIKQGSKDNVLEFHNRKGMGEKIGEVKVTRPNEEIKSIILSPIKKNFTKGNSYIVLRTKVRPKGSNEPFAPCLKVIDLEKFELVQTIELPSRNGMKRWTLHDAY